MQKRILIMAGGTGGHVFPALAIAEALRQQSIDVQWLGTSEGIEARLVPAAGISLHFMTISGVRGKGWQKKLLSPFKISVAVLQAIKLIHELKPQAVLGFGGYASGPGGLAAFLLNIPLLIHEQNATPSMTNRILAHMAKKIMQAFPHTFPASNKVILTGNPVRESILHLPSPDTRFQHRNGALRVLVLGGSGGALALNQIIPEVLKRLPVGFCEIWHQSGRIHFDVTKKRYAELGVTAKLEPFINDMAEAYAWADIVICRAGALTIAELAAAGVASILIPFPFATDDHQTKNAHYLADKGAAVLLPQTQLQVQTLTDTLMNLTRDALLEKSKKAYALRLADATPIVVKQCQTYLGVVK